uniref:Uncharacterized protein n=1 Tax=Anguilla anguilla TaxID=7936 RepID=A0A0E9R534_ANGAN
MVLVYLFCRKCFYRVTYVQCFNAACALNN